ncbi:MAG: MBL fold metallo-hydrolase, partial [Ignavibacteria bacterium]|nr:MBL fold metallo-hydrolase [Ignavibacteria bacterium]
YTGLAALIVQMKMCKRNETLTIFVHEELVNVINDFLINSFLFPERLGFKINYEPFTIKKSFLINDEIEFLADQNSHLTELTEHENYSNISFTSLSFLFKVEGKRIHYTGDVGGEEDLYIFKDIKTDVFITETTHISLEEILIAVEKINPSKLLLTHITEEDESKLNFDLNQLPEEVRKNTIIATDGLKIKL